MTNRSPRGMKRDFKCNENEIFGIFGILTLTLTRAIGYWRAHPAKRQPDRKSMPLPALRSNTYLSERRATVILAGFALVVALLGGSSRHDAIQLVVLRPASALFLAVPLYFIGRANLTDVKPLLAIFGSFVFWMAVQLVPLPPSIWTSLPGRELIAELDRIAGLEGAWRPLSFTPGRTFNALLALVVPGTALLLAISLGARARHLLLLVAGLGVFNALLGLLQVLDGRFSPLYLYAITNHGSPVGFFANENHAAVFSAISLIIIAKLAAYSKQHREPTLLRLSYAAGYACILLSILVGGSRVGLVSGIFALAISAIIVGNTFRARGDNRDRSRLAVWVRNHPRSLLSLFASTIFLLIGAFVALDRTPALENILSQDPLEDFRWKVLPILQVMIEDHWLFGAGFGSFDKLYLIYEPTEYMRPQYFNQAHNDWAQLIIEGGLPTILLLVWLLAWIANRVWRLAKGADSMLVEFLSWGGIFAIICAASFVDYPLRVPVFQLATVWILLALARESGQP